MGGWRLSGRLATVRAAHLLDYLAVMRRIGMPVDRVQGLITGRTPTARTSTLIVERREVGGRIVAILDPRVLVERAGEIIERAVA